MKNNIFSVWRLVKESVDRLVAFCVLALLSPVFLVLYTVVLLCVGRPVFFTQSRPGHHGQIFKFFKFRTMTNECDLQGNLLPDEKRLIPIGQFLRQTSLDELPQLFNVLRGDMSFVGPRPLLVEYLDRYTPEQSRRHEAKPGITGWAQINGRNSLDWEHKFILDVWYVDNWSLWLDLKVLILTVLKVLKREGISQQGHVTMKKFEGSVSLNSPNQAVS